MITKLLLTFLFSVIILLTTAGIFKDINFEDHKISASIITLLAIISIIGSIILAFISVWV